MAVVTRPPEANRRAFHHSTAEIEQPEPEAGGEVQDQAEGHGPGGQMGEGEPAHALFIHFQADQQPSARPSIRSGAVQNSPE